MKRIKPLAVLAILTVALAGCASDAGKATAEDKRAIEDLAKNGLRPSPPPGGTPAGTPSAGGGGVAPASGAVAPP